MVAGTTDGYSSDDTTTRVILVARRSARSLDRNNIVARENDRGRWKILGKMEKLERKRHCYCDAVDKAGARPELRRRKKIYFPQSKTIATIVVVVTGRGQPREKRLSLTRAIIVTRFP